VPTAIVVTVVVTPLATMPPPAASCSVRQDWLNYVVQPGDTLARIAARANTSASVLAQANCLANMNLITTGQVLKVPVLLPPLTPTATSPTMPTSTSTPPEHTRTPSLEQGVVRPDSWISAVGGSYWLRAGTTVTLTWYDAPGGLASATFYTTTYRGTRQDIGTDSNPSDGVSMSFTVPYGLGGLQWRADGYGLNAAPFDYAYSQPSSLNSEINADQCYVQFLGDQPLYEGPDPSSAIVGTAPAGTVYPVIAWSDAWMQINLYSGWLPPDGAISTYGGSCP
jgi:murein DD-endopeptidase MepM/ murein hydrolase activator NlpD